MIECTIRVKQGCPLSLALFGLYIDQTFDYIDRGRGNGASLAGVRNLVLIFADDIVLIADTPKGMYRHLEFL